MRNRFATLVIGSVLLVAGSATAAGGKVYVVDGCAPHGVRPDTVILFCGDAGVILDQLKWSSFGGSKARASGRRVVKTCDPDCASGGVRTANVELVFSKRGKCQGFAGRYYRQVRARTANGTKRYDVPCPVG
jgi:hypothetical protein